MLHFSKNIFIFIYSMNWHYEMNSFLIAANLQYIKISKAKAASVS